MTFNKLSTIHIHTDYKFISNTTVFDGEHFENTIIIIQNNIPYEGPFKDIALLLNRSSKDVNKIVKICKNADLVVLYELDKIKSKIALKLPHYVKIAWRFFGYELYGKPLSSYISNKSSHALGIYKIPLHNRFINIFRKGFNLIKYDKPEFGLFYDAIKRINYFLGLSQEEYDFLSHQWYVLPAFVKFPLLNYSHNAKYLDLSIKKEEKKPIIIIGNSKSVYNNHLDIISLIEKEPNKHCFNFLILFNYGAENAYTNAVRQSTDQKNYYTVVEEFMPIEDLNHLYKKTTALVINGYRQMALYNIFEGFRNGVKIYLNKNNIILQWFINEGFYVFSIADFEKDLQNNNLELSDKIAQHNLNRLVSLCKKYTPLYFQKVLYSKVIVNHFTVPKQ